jgi:glycerate dehydrogenase
MQGVFLDSKTLNQKDLDFSVITSTLETWKLYQHTQPALVANRIHNADIIVTNKTSLTELMLQKATHLRCICIAATGSDHVDIAAAARRGITVCNVVDYSTASVIQHTIGLLIELASKISQYDDLVKQGAWINNKYFCLQNYKTLELSGKVLGIVGYGVIGRGVAKVAKALGMKVLVATRPGKKMKGQIPLAQLLPLVDVLSLHCPLNAETVHLIAEKEIAKMKRSALLLNVSRGGLVDELALARALLSGRLAGAALDVSSEEPPKHDSPLFSQPIPRLIMTPHVAWSTSEARQRLLQEVAANIRAFLAGAPRNVIA